MEIPKDKVGLIIGRKGRRLKEIKELSGAHVDVKDDKVHLRGTPEQCEKAKKYIEEILNPVSIGGFSFRKVGDALSQRKNKRFGPFEPNLDLKKRGKTPSRGYTIAGQRKQTNQSNCGVEELNPGHIGERRVLSSLHQPWYYPLGARVMSLWFR